MKDRTAKQEQGQGYLWEGGVDGGDERIGLMGFIYIKEME
jgi:hypothetical protein